MLFIKSVLKNNRKCEKYFHFWTVHVKGVLYHLSLRNMRHLTHYWCVSLLPSWFTKLHNHSLYINKMLNDCVINTSWGLGQIRVRPKDVLYSKQSGSVRREITRLDWKHQLNPPTLPLWLSICWLLSMHAHIHTREATHDWQWLMTSHQLANDLMNRLACQITDVKVVVFNSSG